MKKFLISFVLIFTLIISLSLGKNLNDDLVYAQDESSQYLFVLGTGEVTASADTMEIKLGLISSCDDLTSCQTNMTNNFNTISNKIKEIDPQAKVILTYSSCHPICYNGECSYECKSYISIISNMLNEHNNFIKIATENGANSYHSTQYSLKDNNDLFNKALLNAKENAQQKALLLHNDITLNDLFEVKTFSYQYDDQIKVQTLVKAKFKINNQSTQNQTQQPEYNKNNDVNYEVKEDDGKSSSFYKIID